MADVLYVAKSAKDPPVWAKPRIKAKMEEKIKFNRMVG